MPEYINISVRGTKLSSANQEKLRSKLQSHFENYQDLITRISIEISQNRTHRGVDNDYAVRMLVTVPNAMLRVKKEGADIFTVFDKTTVSMEDRLRSYKETIQEWRKDNNWVEAHLVHDANTGPEDEGGAQYSDYQPRVRVKELGGLPPMSTSEAIFNMEMLGRNSFLFRNSDTNQIEMLYKEGSEYNLIRPPKV